MKEKTFTKQICKLSLSSVILLSLFLVVGCSSDTNEQTLTTFTGDRTNNIQTITKSGDVQSFLSKEPTLSNFRQVMNNIHSLKTLTKIKSKQVILFLPTDAAFGGVGTQEKEKLLAKSNLTLRHQLVKNSIVLHEKRQGDWNGVGTTYGGLDVKVDFEKGTISSANTHARILQQIQLEDGHLLFILDNLINA